MLKHSCLTIVLLMSALLSIGQTVVGRVNNFTNEPIEPLPGASVMNITGNVSAVADKNGYYTIRAKEKDLLVFSFTGFKSDTVKVEQQFFISGYDAALIEAAAFLSGVTIMSYYKKDSLRRRQEYAHIFEKQPGITGGNTPQAGVGIVLSPFSFFSKENKEKKRLKKRFEQQEEEAYIDYMFSPPWVSSLTGLKDDSLNLFMRNYRPSYQFLRRHNRTELITYVSDKYKEFRTSKKVQ